MKDNFQVVTDDFSFCCMQGESTVCFPAEGEYSATNGYSWGDPVVDIKGDESASSSGGGAKISADDILKVGDSAVELAKLLGTKRQLTEVEGVCGKQPRPLLFGKAKKERWAKCASDYVATKMKPIAPPPSRIGARIFLPLLRWQIGEK